MDEFFRSRMGRVFIEGTMPKIAENLERIAQAQEEANRLKRIELEDKLGKDGIKKFYQKWMQKE